MTVIFSIIVEMNTGLVCCIGRLWWGGTTLLKCWLAVVCALMQQTWATTQHFTWQQRTIIETLCSWCVVC